MKIESINANKDTNEMRQTAIDATTLIIVVAPIEMASTILVASLKHINKN
jgi:hypothetical protein